MHGRKHERVDPREDNEDKKVFFVSLFFFSLVMHFIGTTHL